MKAAGQSFYRAMTWLRLVLVLGSLVCGLGCKPKIGEDCATSIDCSISNDRICDATQPGGYCTVFNCEPNGCPEEAVCVAFGEGTCSTPSVSTRFRRTFCMRKCDDDSDCRGGSYRCSDVSRDPARQIVDSAPSSRRICAVMSLNPQPPSASNSEPAICYPSDASFDVSRPEAGPTSPDAPAEASADRAPDDRRDSKDGEPGVEASADDVLDSSHSETGDDAASDDAASDDVDDATSDGVDDAAEEPEATLSPP
jgi:hypothetical protein